MEFNQQTLAPTYHFKSGIPGSSYAIEMAQRIGMSAKLIERSREFRGVESNKMEDLILDLEKKSQNLNSLFEAAEEEKTKFKALNTLYENKIRHLEKELKEIKSQAIIEAESIIEKANTTIEKTVREIRESSAEKKTVVAAREHIRSITKEVSELREQNIVSSIAEEFSVGDMVKLKDGDVEGEIVSKVDKDHFIVLVGAIRLNIDRKDLLRAQRRLKTSISRSTNAISAELRQELDLRGMYADEAINAVEKFFDKAILSGLHKVHLIHGKGTGALRRKINNYLEQSPAIVSFHLGEWNEGGDGVTVVELK